MPRHERPVIAAQQPSANICPEVIIQRDRVQITRLNAFDPNRLFTYRNIDARVQGQLTCGESIEGVRLLTQFRSIPAIVSFLQQRNSCLLIDGRQIRDDALTFLRRILSLRLSEGQSDGHHPRDPRAR